MSTSTDDGSRKRARSEEPQPFSASETARVKDEHFWYEDGTVILVAKNVEFRVYKGILADHSPVFKDMFSLPQPPETASMECPIVEVADSPEDLRHILSVYMPKKEPSPFLPNPSFDMISASIRLGHKYQMTNLVDHSVNYLIPHYTDFDHFSSNQKPHGPPSFIPEHSIGVVNLARLTGQDVLLPSALFICCTLGESLIQGFQREDGTWERLSPEDFAICFKAKPKLFAQALILFAKLFDNEKPRISCSENCFDTVEWARTLSRGAKDIASKQPLCSILGGSVLVPGFCFRCIELLRQRERENRYNLWTRLPVIFGISTTLLRR